MPRMVKSAVSRVQYPPVNPSEPLPQIRQDHLAEVGVRTQFRAKTGRALVACCPVGGDAPHVFGDDPRRFGDVDGLDCPRPAVPVVLRAFPVASLRPCLARE